MDEKRQHRRVQIRVPVLCEPDEGETFAGLIVDVGLGGCCIECSEVPVSGTRMAIAARLPGSPELSHTPAVVRWATPGVFGVELGELEERQIRVIAGLADEAEDDS